MDDEVYRQHLTNALYADIATKAGPDWHIVSKCLMARVPGGALASEWARFAYFTSNAGPTAAELAEVVLDCMEKEKAPNAVLSFNAEPLLFSMLNAVAAARFRHRKAISATDETQTGPGVVDRIEGSTSWAKKGRVPYYFCHGFLPLPSPAKKHVQKKGPAGTYESKMVFSESDYLSLANHVMSWQSSVFIRAAMSDRIVFVGLSMTDPNMRRWLAWNHSQRLREIQARDPTIKESTQHIWINVASSSAAINRWVEALVSHLGIRMVWINNWSEVGTALRKMLGLVK